MKYVIIKLDAGATPRVYPFTFSERLTHSEMARWFQRAVEKEFNYPAHVYSAGFCEANGSFGMYVREHGSESLRIESSVSQAVKDTAILNLPNFAQDAMPC